MPSSRAVARKTLRRQQRAGLFCVAPAPFALGGPGRLEALPYLGGGYAALAIAKDFLSPS